MLSTRVNGSSALSNACSLRSSVCLPVFVCLRVPGCVWKWKIVQYNVAPGGFGGGNPKLLEKIGPYPMQVSSDRVTVETATLNPTKPDHFLLQAPNLITARDYEGWVQERGLYFARTWDPRYTALWELSDPGEKPAQGGTLFTRYGKGIYIFTPMAWFRQLPAGVPGAYRLFANFLSAGKVTAQ